jgi:endonuclease/exonuclease/phosphatase family metal-dependent hydrolase
VGPVNIRDTACPDEPDKREYVTFMTYNIRVGAGIRNPLTTVRKLTSSEEDLKTIASAIQSVEPQVVALQEVRGSRQVAYLAKALDMNYAYSPHGRKGFDWGLGLLSKFKILDITSRAIHNGWDPRVGAAHTIDINGSPITVINVHYHLGNYQRQVHRTMGLLGDVGGPAVLIGDLNLTEHAAELIPLYGTLIDTCRAVDTNGAKEALKVGTILAFSGHRIDYVFVDPDFFSVKEVGLIADEYRSASDHIAYFARVKFKP